MLLRHIIHVFRFLNKKTWYNTNMVRDTVEQTIKEHSMLTKGDHVVIGVSGGPDSVCLFDVLFELSNEWDLSLHVVHINHQIRGNEAEMDQAYVQRLCKERSIPCTVDRYDVLELAKAQGLTTEEMGRALRYQSFSRVREDLLGMHKGQVDSPGVKIAVAQNRDDQAETVLMRILRGTGTDGLAAMEYVREGVVIRPLLDVSRIEIEAYCKSKGLSPRTDQSNLEPVYLRNRIRLGLLPHLEKQYNKEIRKALNRLAKISNEDKEFLYQSVLEAKKETQLQADRASIPRTYYRTLHPAIRKRLVLTLLKDLGLTQDVTSIHLERADEQILQGHHGEGMDFPKGYSLRINQEEAILTSPTIGSVQGNHALPVEKTCYPVLPDTTVFMPAFQGTLRLSIRRDEEGRDTSEGSNSVVYLDLKNSDCQNNLVVRTRRPGDYLSPFGMRGTKKLQDYFMDEKIPREARDQIPLLCFGQEVLWIIGHRINEKYKVTPDTAEVAILEYTKHV